MKKYLAHYAIPLDLFEEFKKVCQAEGRTMTGTIIMLIRVWLKGIRERGERLRLGTNVAEHYFDKK